MTWLNADCWTNTSDVHGFNGVAQNLATLEQCQEACVNDSTCVAIDWEPANPDDNFCWFLTMTVIGNTTETGVITHYELNRLCLSKSYFHFYLRQIFSYLSLYSNNGGKSLITCVTVI